MKDSLTPGIEIIMPAVAFEKAVQKKHGTNVDAVKQILDNEYNQWLEVRDYVRKNMYKLKGHTTSLEVTSLTDISDPYNCVVINDMDMRTYQAVFEEIKEVEEKEETLRVSLSLDEGLCPSGCGPVELKDDLYIVMGKHVAGHTCSQCLGSWDQDDLVKHLRDISFKLERKGRIKNG